MNRINEPGEDGNGTPENVIQHDFSTGEFDISEARTNEPDRDGCQAPGNVIQFTLPAQNSVANILKPGEDAQESSPSSTAPKADNPKSEEGDDQSPKEIFQIPRTVVNLGDIPDFRTRGAKFIDWFFHLISGKDVPPQPPKPTDFEPTKRSFLEKAGIE